MNKLEGLKNTNTSIPSSNIISSSSNNINDLGFNKPNLLNNNNVNNNVNNSLNENIVSSQSNKINQNGNTGNNENNKNNEAVGSSESSENLEGALKKLNDEMNKDIDKTVNDIPMQTGGRKILKMHHKININKTENNLTNKIKLLRLKLTKNKLQKQLGETKSYSLIKKNKKKTTLIKSKIK